MKKTPVIVKNENVETFQRHFKSAGIIYQRYPSKIKNCEVFKVLNKPLEEIRPVVEAAYAEINAHPNASARA